MQHADRLPDWSTVLVVVAHPDDESFALGAVLDAFARQGAEVHVLCLTRGEASTLGVADGIDLATVRERELDTAAAALGVEATTLCGHPDGALSEVPTGRLVRDVGDVLDRVAPDGVLVFDPRAGVTGHRDHEAASLAALAAAGQRDLPALGWALPEAIAERLDAEFGAAFVGYPDAEIDLEIPVDRAHQLEAVHAHATQAVPGSVLWRRIELSGNRERLRWLRRAP